MTKKPRRTQQERSQSTREKLLDATISCLITDGYSEITTTKVCRLSGMSQGAIFKHFPTKNALIIASIAKLYDQLIHSYELIVHAFPADGDRIALCLSALWHFFDTPEVLAVFDLHIAARTDADFQQELAPFERKHREKIRDAAARIFPELADNPQFHAGIEIILMVVQGSAIGNLAVIEPNIHQQKKEVLHTIARSFLAVIDE